MRQWLTKINAIFYQHTRSFFIASSIGLVLYHISRWRLDRNLASEVSECQSTATPGQSTPMVSILVAAWNEASLIDAHIEALRKLRYPHRELILCAGGTDGTYTIANRYAEPWITVLRQNSGEGKQAALRRCLQYATGAIVFLTDADCLVSNEAFERTLAPILAGEAVASTGGFVPLTTQRQSPFVIMQWCSDNYARAYSPARISGWIEGLIGRNAALTRELLARTGDFAHDVRIGTDYYLACQILNLGEQIRYVHNSRVATSFAVTPRHYIHQQSRWLRNILQQGLVFGMKRHITATLGQCLSGAIMILWPLTFPLIKRPGIAIWLLALTHGTLARWRYLRFGELSLGMHSVWTAYLLAPIFLLFDMFILLYTLIVWRIPTLRWQW